MANRLFNDPDALADTLDHPIPHAFVDPHADNYINADHHLNGKPYRLPNCYPHSITWQIFFHF